MFFFSFLSESFENSLGVVVILPLIRIGYLYSVANVFWPETANT